MSAFLHQLVITLRLHFRNRMALLYGYLFPLIFTIAFWVLYRHESVPLARHMGELLTVTVLGGACFGLPTTMVSERERGVWRRYRLAPVSTAGLAVSTIVARYFILITAALLQLSLAMAVGMPLPRHPFNLWVAFTFVSFAFLGLGLVMAMMADTVPAVQALGQCIFLPMLIIGGVAVPLASLPDWAQHLSAFFPGRYAVDALQACVTGDGLEAGRFNLLALLLVGAAGCLAGAQMFRWDAQQRFATRGGKGWVAVALAGWAAVGLLAESQGRVAPGTRAAAEIRTPPNATSPPAARPSETSAPITAPTPAETPHSPKRAPGVTPPSLSEAEKAAATPPSSASAAAEPPSGPANPPSTPATSSWREVTMADIDRDLVFDRLPADQGIVTPIAPLDEDPDPEVAAELEKIRTMLPQWAPGRVSDPVQRVRNLLYVAAVPDVFQLPLERYTPHVVFERLQEDIPKDQLIKVLYWIALHPGDGDDAAVDQLWALGFENRPVDMQQTRERAAIYGVKLLGRLTGKI